MRKILYFDEMMPLVTFVDHIKNTTDCTLLSMQRELAKKETQLAFVIDQQKFTAEEHAYLAYCTKQKCLFKRNFLDKENARYEKEVKHWDRLLKEGEELVQSCKLQINIKNEKLQQLQTVIDEKDHLLDSKLIELSRLQSLLSNDSDSSKVQMKSYILSTKLKNTKNDIRRLKNDKNELETTAQDYNREIDRLKTKLSELKTRSAKEATEVKTLEHRVGDITAKITDEIEKQSRVSSNQEKLQKVLNDKIKHKENLLKEVSMRKQMHDTSRYSTFIDTKTLRPSDWNKIDDSLSMKSDEKYSSNPRNSLNLRNTFKKSMTKKMDLINSNEEVSKEEISIDNVYDKQSDLSLISFEADWESTHSDTRLPISSQNDSKYQFVNKIASSGNLRSLSDAIKINEDVNTGKLFTSQILEENDEESESNLTPRLSEEHEREITLKEEADNKMYMNRDRNGKIDKTVYASKTTLETEETSMSKFDDDNDFLIFDKKERENQLSFSALSSSEYSIDEKNISPSSILSKDKMPILDLTKVRKLQNMNNRSISEMSGSTCTMSGSKHGKLHSSLETSMTTLASSAAKPKTNHAKPSHQKKQSQSKPLGSKLHKAKTEAKLTKSDSKQKKMKAESGEGSWKDSKFKVTTPSFKGDHWSFAKKNATTTHK